MERTGSSTPTSCWTTKAANQLPDTTAISSGSWRPANWPAAGDVFPAPAPAQSANVNLSTFDGMAPDGSWTLWVQDDLEATMATSPAGR